MKKILAVLNLIGALVIVVVCAQVFLSDGESATNVDHVAIIGGPDGPTSIYSSTIELSWQTWTVATALMILLCANAITLLRSPAKGTDNTN